MISSAFCFQSSSSSTRGREALPARLGCEAAAHAPWQGSTSPDARLLEGGQHRGHRACQQTETLGTRSYQATNEGLSTCCSRSGESQWEPERSEGRKAWPSHAQHNGWEEGAAPANYRATAAFPGNEEAAELLRGIQVDSDHNQKLPLPFAYANRAAQLQSSRALYSCQVGAVNAAETRVGQPAWQEHLIRGKNGTAASLPADRAPPGVCQAPGLAGGILKSSRQKKS